MPKISAIIITYNEEKSISRCIDSLKQVADEIVVVDSYSKDFTKKICEERGVRFIEHVFNGHIEQKNFALAQARFENVISLDADEYLSDELIQSIATVKKTWPYDAYQMNRLSTYGKKWIKRGNWYPDKKVRLWNKNLGMWGGKNPHDQVILKRGVKLFHLNGDILHQAYEDSAETLQKVQSYSDIYAKQNAGHESSSVLKIIFRASFTFFKSYIIKKGIFDGFEGLMVAMAEANHTFYKYAKLYEANRKHVSKTRKILDEPTVDPKTEQPPHLSGLPKMN
ncbi:MAG: glycosyltransferase family 2 protein [Bacteroidetes bacterium]|nr:glycosyltransferase family 2 protein [Bacteroidota bacterium]